MDGHSLTIDDLVQIGLGQYYVKLSEECVQNVMQSRKVIDNIVKSEKGIILT